MRKTEPRTSFTPDSLAKFAKLFEEVWNELVLEEVLKPGANADDPSRARLAKRVFRLARSPWSDNQMRQLLVRAFRNEAARLQRAN
jgi:hypothetical protein